MRVSAWRRLSARASGRAGVASIGGRFGEASGDREAWRRIVVAARTRPMTYVRSRASSHRVSRLPGCLRPALGDAGTHSGSPSDVASGSPVMTCACSRGGSIWRHLYLALCGPTWAVRELVDPATGNPIWRCEMAAAKRGRSAKSGKFVKQSTVRRNPGTTVNETVKKGKKK